MAVNARGAESRVAVLHQAAESPAVNGVRKPMKPLGLSNSIPPDDFSLLAQGREETRYLDNLLNMSISI